MTATSIKTEFSGHSGATLAARLDIPAGHVRAYALFAHCFTCSKDILAAKRVAAELARAGIAVLRFDFTGLGSSEGEFASTNFSSVQCSSTHCQERRDHSPAFSGSPSRSAASRAISAGSMLSMTGGFTP